LEDFFEIPATDAREMGGYDLWRSRGLLRPNLLRLAYGLLGFARSETDDTSARDENDRDLPPKNFDSPGLLQNSRIASIRTTLNQRQIPPFHQTPHKI
jgi:hypothetical protein